MIASFIAASAYSHYTTSSIDVLARQIARNSSPSVLALAAARTELRHIGTLMERYAASSRSSAGPPTDQRAAIERVWRSYTAHVFEYLELPVADEEREHWSALSVESGRFEATLSRVLALFDSSQADLAQAVMMDELRIHTDAMSDAIGASIRHNAQQAQASAQEIETIRSRSVKVTVGLDLLCAGLALLLGFLLLRTFRDYIHLVEAHRVELERRNSELEVFAGRVAHDIVSPLSAAASSLDVAQKHLGGEASAQAVIAAGKRSVARVKRIVDGLLDFARAGAYPTPDAVALPREVLEDVLDDSRPAAQSAALDLRASIQCERAARCSSGALTSVLSNLVSNAIKYTGPDRAGVVEVRIQEAGDHIRIEVADNGPGLPPGLDQAVFEPYVRAVGSGLPGIGLGLATVRRIVEAHGGRVGVVSVPGGGCTFWVELPSSPPPASTTSAIAERLVH